MTCPMHKERIGVEDDRASLAVYRKNVHCFGCSFHITRRYASLAFLLGEWDGRGSENSWRVQEAVRRVKRRLRDFVGGHDPLVKAYIPPPPSEYTVEAFHQYLLKYAEDRLVDELMTRRGLNLETIRTHRIGYTGTHFTLPVPKLDDGYETIRYRADEYVLDPYAPEFRKYEGSWGRNYPVLYPVRVLRGLSEVEELWIVEGEFDALAGNQSGCLTLTVTNGATNAGKAVGMVRDLGIQVGRWTVATDQDAAGEIAAASIMSALEECGGVGRRARWGRGKDLTEYLASGGSKRRIWYD